MAKKLTEKYNDACVKLFEFIKMLYEGDVEFKTVLDHFSDGTYDGSSNTHVTINKYLNAMKIFGIQVIKSDNKYKMLTSPYKISFNLEDLKCINILKDGGQILTDNKNKTNFEKFIQSLEVRYDEVAQNFVQITNKSQRVKIFHSEILEQIKQCEKYCQEKQKLEIVFCNENNEDINLICSPIEQIYFKRKICLKVLGNNGSRIYEIPINSIKSIKQLPTASSTQAIPTTVVYRIKNRLAKNYKIRDWEKLDNIEQDGSHIIINKNEDLNILIKRLMRYGTECEIISPKFFKEEMITTINQTLENYK